MSRNTTSQFSKPKLPKISSFLSNGWLDMFAVCTVLGSYRLHGKLLKWHCCQSTGVVEYSLDSAKPTSVQRRLPASSKLMLIVFTCS